MRYYKGTHIFPVDHHIATQELTGSQDQGVSITDGSGGHLRRDELPTIHKQLNSNCSYDCEQYTHLLCYFINDYE